MPVVLNRTKIPQPTVPHIDHLQLALGLTTAEAEVVRALAEGHSLREIADQSHRAVTTVRWHIKQVKAKLGVSRQVELVRLALAVVEPK